MEEGDCDFRENKVVAEGLEVAGDEAVVDEHQVFDEMPVGVRQFYFVKVLAHENSNTDAMIKAEETITKMNQDRILIAQKIRDRQMDRDQVIAKLNNQLFHENWDEFDLKCYRDRMNLLHLSLEKLTSVNKACKGKPNNSCLSRGKVNKQELSFLMLHGCKNVADERKLLREVNARQKNDGGATVDEVNSSNGSLLMHLWHWPMDIQIARAVKRNEGIDDNSTEGELWSTSRLKNAIQEEEIYDCSDYMRRRQARFRSKVKKTTKELEKVEKGISSLQKHLIYTNRRKAEAYDTILKLKKLYGEENASHYQYRSLMKKVEVLAKKKDIAALEELSQGQVDKFMQQWNSCLEFRNDYRRRVVPSLYSRDLCVDGRMINNQKSSLVEDARKVTIPEVLSKTRLKWLMKDAEDLSELLSL
ncbi:proton pump-interactor BIP131-like isoform X2 [Benincasa hispida]|uniref:proton pump-interactor BIP131-like isoform X2 n=1 Tax=Benincasa hispida TaxID=102211 RepID=UPI00190167B9|nr:proton pump-interactor BIP131-like isoform X2 [Benincasa hispida]